MVGEVVSMVEGRSATKIWTDKPKAERPSGSPNLLTSINYQWMNEWMNQSINQRTVPTGTEATPGLTVCWSANDDDDGRNPNQVFGLYISTSSYKIKS